MLPVELIFLTARILKLPPVASVYGGGLAMLRQAFAEADFEVGEDILPERQGVSVYVGGFDMRDPATDGELRVMLLLGHSSTTTPEAGGLAYSWMVMQSFDQLRSLPADQRGLLTQEVRAHRITPLALAAMDAEAVLAQYEEVLAAPEFCATMDEARGFVRALLDTLAP